MGKLRALRSEVVKALCLDDWSETRAGLEAFNPKDLIGPLYACLLDPAPLVRWRAVDAFGLVGARLADQSLEAARQLMRQMMWRLNEESGNIAWGIPESFGAILAAHPGLAREFNRVLASYINERECETGDNYLELDALRQGVYWGLARLAGADPSLAAGALNNLVLALQREDPVSRALAALALGRLLHEAGAHEAMLRAELESLKQDPTPVEIYLHGTFAELTVGKAASLALDGVRV